MRGHWRHGVALAGVLALAGPAMATPARVERVALNTSEGHTTLQVALSADSRYRLFTLSSPDRVVLDILPARLGPVAQQLPPGVGAVRRVRAADRPDGSVRLVLDLAARAEPQGTMQRAAGAAGTLLVVDLRTRPPTDRFSDSQAVAPAVAPASAALPPPVTGPLASVPPAAAAPAPGATPVVAVPVAREPVADATARPPDPPPVVAGTTVAASPPSTPSRAVESQAEGRDIVIAIDAGHGGKDPGAHGPRGVREKDVTLALARRLAEVVNAEPGMRGVLTRNRDEFIPLRGRMERARAAQADLFVSIHADAVRNPSVRGASVYVLNEKGATDEAARRLAARENAADLIGGVSLRSKDPTLASVLLDLSQNASLSSSIDVADDILEELARVGTVRKPRVMQAPFMVLKSPDVPSVLVETAYISNPEEERRLDSHAWRSKLAGAIFAGIRDYFYANPPRGTLVAELSRRRLAGTVEHVVRDGETLSAVAVRYSSSVALIRAANRLPSDRVVVGQVLRIPRSTET
jgi:N-acetylmuramoyl-L-alanine amidase